MKIVLVFFLFIYFFVKIHIEYTHINYIYDVRKKLGKKKRKINTNIQARIYLTI